jgi:signal transduction histidine kinase
MVFSSFAVLIILSYLYPLPYRANLNIDVIRISVTILTSILLLISIWHFYSTNITAEEKLLEEKKKADEANRAKSVFLANMSHELRTPLNAMLGFTQLLAREPGLSKEQLTQLGLIGRSGDHLLALINDVLEFTKIESDKMELHNEPFALHRFLLGLEEMFRLQAEQKGLALKFILEDHVPPLSGRIKTNSARS